LGKAVDWYTADELSGGWPSLTLGGYCILESTIKQEKPSCPYLEREDMVLCDGDSLQGLSATGSVTISQDLSQKTTGVGSVTIAFSSKDGLKNQVVQSFSSASNLQDYTDITFDVFFAEKPSADDTLTLSFLTDSIATHTYSLPLGDYEVGWHKITLQKDGFTPAEPLADWGAIKGIGFSSFNDITIQIDNVRATNAPIGYPYIQERNLMIYDGESLSGISVGNHNQMALSTIVKQGNYSVYVKAGNPNDNSDVIAEISVPLSSADLSNSTRVYLDLYLGQDPAGECDLEIVFLNQGQKQLSFTRSLSNLSKGWCRMNLRTDKFVALSEKADWSSVDTLQLVVKTKEPIASSHYYLVDNIYANVVEPTPDFSKTAKLGDSFLATISQNSQNYLSVKESKVVLEPVDSAQEQLWQFHRLENGGYIIKNSATNGILTAVDGTIEQIFYGDLDESDSITAVDALLALQLSVQQITLEKNRTVAADVDGNHSVDAIDALAILKQAIGKTDRLPIEEVSSAQFPQCWDVYTCGAKYVICPLGTKTSSFVALGDENGAVLQLDEFVNSVNQQFIITKIS
jgi:hypothetical protein